MKAKITRYTKKQENNLPQYRNGNYFWKNNLELKPEFWTQGPNSKIPYARSGHPSLNAK
jgi:hypothetical protein